MSRIKLLKKEAEVALPTSGETYVAEDGTVSMVLDDEHDDNFVPSDSEVQEYAEWLGMTFPDDNELIWIAKEGLKAPLPKEWKPCKTDTGEVYYFNFKTGDSTWDHPMDDHFKNKYKTEKDRMKKRKEGIEVITAVSRLPQRNNTIFTENGILKTSEDDQSPPEVTPRASHVNQKNIVALGGNSNKSNAQQTATTPSKFTVSTTKNNTTTTLKSAVAGGITKKESLSNSQQSKGIANKTSILADNEPEDNVKEVPLFSKVREVGSDSSATLNKLNNNNNMKSNDRSADFKSNNTTVLPTTAEKTVVEPVIESPRLISEAEKKLESKIREEMEIKHTKVMKKLEEDIKDKIAGLRHRREKEIEKLNEELNAKTKKAVRKIEEELQNEMDGKKQRVEIARKREIRKLEEEISDLQDQVKKLESKASTTSSADQANVIALAKREAAALAKRKISDIIEEIDEIRHRHKKHQRDILLKEKAEIEREVLTDTLANYKCKIKKEFEDKMEDLRTSHDALVKKLMRQYGDEIEEMQSAAERSLDSKNANWDALAIELRDRQASKIRIIEQQCEREIDEADEQGDQLLKRTQKEFADELSCLQEEYDAKWKAHCSDCSGVESGEVTAALKQLDKEYAEKKAKYEEGINSRKRLILIDLKAKREEALKKVVENVNKSASSSDGTNTQIQIEKIRQDAEITRNARLAQLIQVHNQKVSAIKADIEQKETANKAAIDRITTELQDTATENKFREFVRETLERRAQEQHEYDMHKRDLEKKLSEQQALSKATETAESSKNEATARVQAEIESEFYGRAKEIRDASSKEKTQKMLALADELAVIEKSRRDAVNAEVQAAVEKKSAELERNLAAVIAKEKASMSNKLQHTNNDSDASSGSECVTPESQEPVDESSDDEQAVLSTLCLAPLLDVDEEVQRQTAMLIQEYERKELQLRQAMKHSTTGYLPLYPNVRGGNQFITPQNSVTPTPLGSPVLRHNVQSSSSNSTPRQIKGPLDVLKIHQELAERQEAILKARQEWEDEMRQGNYHDVVSGNGFGMNHTPRSKEQQQVINKDHSIDVRSSNQSLNVYQQRPQMFGRPRQPVITDPSLLNVIHLLNGKFDSMSKRMNEFSSEVYHSKGVGSDSK